MSASEKNEKIVQGLSQQEFNKQCADCSQRGTRWASWNIGVFLCIQCGGHHRKLGTHVSKVKSITLDSWSDEQVQSIQNKGNAKMNSLFNPNNVPLPSNPNDMERYIRDKYEKRKFTTESTRATLSEMFPISSNRSQSPYEIASQSQTSYLPPNISSYFVHKHTNSLMTLYDMGFRNPSQNLDTLELFSSDLQQTIEYLINLDSQDSSLSTSEPSTPSNTIRSSHLSISQPSPSLSHSFEKKIMDFEQMTSLLEQLRNMGFKNNTVNKEALVRFKGNLEDVINYIVDQQPTENQQSDSLVPSSSSSCTTNLPETLLNLTDESTQEPLQSAPQKNNTFIFKSEWIEYE